MGGILSGFNSSGFGQGNNVKIQVRADGSFDLTELLHSMQNVRGGEPGSTTLAGTFQPGSNVQGGPSDFGAHDALNFAMQVGQTSFHAAKQATPAIHAVLVGPIGTALIGASLKKIAEDFVGFLKTKLEGSGAPGVTINLYGPQGEVLKVIKTSRGPSLRTEVTVRDSNPIF